MRSLYKSVFTIFVFVVLLCACGGADGSYDQIVLSASQDEQGAPGVEQLEFTTGDVIVLGVHFTQAYEGLAVEIQWKFEDQVVEAQTVEVPRAVDSLNPLWLTTILKTDEDWSVGSYVCRVFVPDQGDKTLEFTIKKEQ